jgi:predicted amidohydrolase
MKIKITVAQYDVPENVYEAKEKALAIANEASSKEIQVLVLPETALEVLKM